MYTRHQRDNEFKSGVEGRTKARVLHCLEIYCRRLNTDSVHPFDFTDQIAVKDDHCGYKGYRFADYYWIGESNVPHFTFHFVACKTLPYDSGIREPSERLEEAQANCMSLVDLDVPDHIAETLEMVRQSISLDEALALKGVRSQSQYDEAEKLRQRKMALACDKTKMVIATMLFGGNDEKVDEGLVSHFINRAVEPIRAIKRL